MCRSGWRCQGPCSKFSSGGGGGGGLERQTSKDVSTGGVKGKAHTETFDFNSSQMPRNASKINQRNP